MLVGVGGAHVVCLEKGGVRFCPPGLYLAKCVVSREKGRTDVVDRYTARVERIHRWNGQEIAEGAPSLPDHLHPKLLLGSR